MSGRTAWRLLDTDAVRARALARALGVHPAAAQILLHRGVTAAPEARRFLAPSLDDLADPGRVPHLLRAADRLRQAADAGERVFVFGDSDVDGVTAAAIVTQALRSLGAAVDAQSSNRREDGYGFPDRLARAVGASGATVAVIVDCGTNQPDAIAALSAEGVDVVILDHHLPGERVAQPFALVNAHVDGAPGRELCSAGLAFKLAQALYGGDAGRLLPLLDLAALGTLADYAPLVGDNRIIVALGMARLLDGHRPGLVRVCDDVRLTSVSPDRILQRLVPRLNAAGRLGQAQQALDLLLCEGSQPTTQLHEAVRAAHATTRQLHQRMLLEAQQELSRAHFKDHSVVVVGRQGWHAGLTGPLASQLAQRYDRPAIAIALDGQVGVGSARCVSAFNLFEALQACDATLLRYGGHAKACGLTVATDQVESLRATINQHAASVADRQSLQSVRVVDVELALDELTDGLVEDLGRLAPFGAGNPRPQVLIRGVQLESDTNPEPWITDGRARVRMRGRAPALLPDERYDLVGTPAVLDGIAALSVGDARLSA